MAQKRIRSAGSKRIRGARPKRAARGVVRRSTARVAARKGASSKRAQSRNLRRKAARRKAVSLSNRARPAVRPAATPRRVMPKAGSGSKSRRPRIQTRRTAPPSSRQIKKGLQKRTSQAAAAALVGSLVALNAASAHPNISSNVAYVQSALDDLQEQANLSDLQADITNLDSNLHHALNLLESARDKGYKFQKDLEEIAFDAMSQWQKIRDEVVENIEKQAETAAQTLNPVNKSLKTLNANINNAVQGAKSIGALESEIDRAATKLRDIENKIDNAYSGIESQASKLNYRLTKLHWALTQLDEASFQLAEEENLYMAVAARWDQEGKNDPEGVLYLTDKSLIFERKEKVATKKVLFITTVKELVQETMLTKPLTEVKSTKAQSKGLFGHQDFLVVKFDDQEIPFHINGQDSEKWSHMIKDAKSGKFADDIASGSGLAFSDLTGEITEADIIEIQNEVNELQDEMMLKHTGEEIAELENKTSGLIRELGDLRSRGYVIEKNLEVDIEVLTAQWEKIQNRADITLKHQTKLLSESMKAAQEKLATLAGMTGNLAAARPIYIQLKSAIASAEAQAEAAEETVLNQYDEYADEVEALDSHMEWIDWMLDALETASFKLLATESGVAAVDAYWERPGLDPENGILFLTDQRLIWEDRTGDTEVKIEASVAQITGVKEEIDEDSGQEELVVEFDSSGPTAKARFSLSLPVAEDWLQMIGRARSDGYAEDRSVEIDKEELDRLRNAPGQCSNCGAAFTAPVLRGQKDISCEYCSVKTRI